MVRRSMAHDAAAGALGVEDGGEKLPAFVLGDFAFGLVAADLLVERVEELLAGGGAGEGGAVVEGATEAAEVEQAFGGAVEGDAHAVEQIDDAGRGLAHGLDGRLVGEEVAAVDGVVEVLDGGVAFALEVLGGVDAALRADRVRALDGDDGEEVDVAAGFGDLDDGGQSGEASANHDDSGCCCHASSCLISCATLSALCKHEEPEDAHQQAAVASHFQRVRRASLDYSQAELVRMLLYRLREIVL